MDEKFEQVLAALARLKSRNGNIGEGTGYRGSTNGFDARGAKDG